MVTTGSGRFWYTNGATYEGDWMEVEATAVSMPSGSGELARGGIQLRGKKRHGTGAICGRLSDGGFYHRYELMGVTP